MTSQKCDCHDAAFDAYREGTWTLSHTAGKFHTIMLESNLATNIKILKRSKLIIPGIIVQGMYSREVMVNGSRE